ncbi:uncharacterized protein LOC123499164 isoform X2 [Portunus trituberculatus]|uniref:uncharacterized protein LOC123499164 isoform X2 n=1 Tax=Portunus trituberculatus TaxID=210409 RepID=UPI001E1CBDF6|nr:uncharacterized protein LOC123499164 isoform X2 [Portunus trituberculatus]
MKILAALVLSTLAAVGVTLPRPQEGQHDDYDGPWPVIPYEYAFEISDEASLTYYSRTETKLPNGDVFGSWAVLLPNDDIQTVVYNVTDGRGFKHTITYSPAEEFGLYR